jgi:hypothetical protein
MDASGDREPGSGLPLLTDDEIVALAARFEEPWRTVLPTVELEAPAAVVAAAARGARSLYVRGLLDLDTDTFDAELCEGLAQLVDKPVRAAVYVMDEAGSVVPGTAAQYYFAAPGDERWGWDGIAAGGVHTFGAAAAVDAHAALLQAITDVFDDGVGGTGNGQPLTLALVGQSATGVRQLRVARGSIVAVQHREDGAAVQVHLAGQVPSVALGWLLEAP